MTEAAIKGRSTSCTFTCEALRSCLRKTTFQANYWRQTTGSGNKAPALSPELLQYRTYYQRLNQRRDGIDIAISPSPRSSNSASWSRSSYGLTRATTHQRIHWGKAWRRLKEGIKDCLNLPKVAEDMKVTKQHFQTIQCGHIKFSGTTVRQWSLRPEKTARGPTYATTKPTAAKQGMAITKTSIPKFIHPKTDLRPNQSHSFLHYCNAPTEAESEAPP